MKGGDNIEIGEDGTISLTGIDPWSVFPPHVPIGVVGVKFGGSDGRRAILPGESSPREDWIKCDGGTDGKGGTVPNLQGRFILGASEDHEAGSTGGSEEHSHSLSGTVGETTLTEAQMPTHKHDIYTGNGVVSGGSSPNVWQGVSHGWMPQTEPTGGSESHTHTQEGETGDVSNLPPYYALAMIMRCA